MCVCVRACALVCRFPRLDNFPFSHLLGVAWDVFSAGRGGFEGEAAERLLGDTARGGAAGLGPDGERGGAIDELEGAREGGREKRKKCEGEASESLFGTSLGAK